VQLTAKIQPIGGQAPTAQSGHVATIWFTVLDVVAVAIFDARGGRVHSHFGLVE
jgi:hypothetical protein